MSVTAGILGATGLAGSVIGAVGSHSAASQQANAANNAANLDFQASQNSLNFQKQQYNNSLQLLQPYYNTGVGALDLLRTGLGIPGAAPSNFQFPGSSTNTPTSNFSFGGGDFTSPIDRISALRGGGSFAPLASDGFSTRGGTAPRTFAFGGGTGDVNLPTANGQPGTVPRIDGGGAPGGQPGGGTNANGNPNIGFGSLLESYPGGPFQAPTSVTEQNDPGYMFRLQTGLDQLQNSAAARGGLLSGGTLKAAQDFAQNDASNEYQNVYNRALNTYGTNYNTFVNNQANQFNRLAAIAGLGQTSAQNLSTAGLETSNAVGSNLLGTANAVGGQLNNAAAARASGITGATNAITGGINNISQLALLSKLLGGGSGGGSGNFTFDPYAGGGFSS